MGWAGWGNWAGSGKQVSGPGGLSPLFFCSVLFFFFYFCNLFLICINIKSFYKILEIIMGAF